MQHFDQPALEWSSVDLADLGFVADIPSKPRVDPTVSVVPLIDRDTMIRRRAYMLWEGAGRPNGTQDAHWLQAAREIDLEYPLARG